MTQRPDPNSTIQQLTVEVANAYKIASDRAEYQIQMLARQLEQERVTVKSLRGETADLQKQVEKLQAQLSAMQLQKTDSTESVATSEFEQSLIESI